MCSATVVPTCSADTMNLYCYTGNILGIYWEYTKNILRIYWEYTGNILSVWEYTENILRVFKSILRVSKGMLRVSGDVLNQYIILYCPYFSCTAVFCLDLSV